MTNLFLERTMTTTKLSISAAFIAAAILSSSAFAHGRDHDHWREHRHHRWAQPVAVRTVYVEPQVIYSAQPVAYQQRVVYQAAPVYYERPVTYTSYNSSRVVGQVVGAVAGGVIGSQIGHGWMAPTAIGAVVGGLVGGNLIGE
jgi:uncharacterized protein YcfJ